MLAGELIPALYAQLDELLRQLQSCLSTHRSLQPIPTRHPFSLLPDTVFSHLEVIVQTCAKSLPAPSDPDTATLVREATSQYVSRWVLDACFVPDQVGTTLSDPATSLPKLCDRLDALLVLERTELVDPVAGMVTLESAFDMLAVDHFGYLLDYIDARRTRLFSGLIPGKGKGLIVLRMANEMRRRLSKPVMNHTLLAGRIATLLSVAFPLGDRSASNLKGEFNLKNQTEWEDVPLPTPEDAKRKASTEPEPKPEHKDEGNNKKRRMDKDRKKVFKLPPLSERVVPSDRLYALFWATQQFFANPALIFESDSVIPDELLNSEVSDSLEIRKSESPKESPKESKGSEEMAKLVAEGLIPVKESFRQLARSLQEIISFFGDVNTFEEHLAGTAAKEEKEKKTLLPTGASTSIASRQAPPSSTEQPMDVDLPSVDEGEDTFYPKYLTGKNNFQSEVRDPSFRRQVMIQILILLQFLLEFSPKRRQVWSEASNKMCHRPWVLGETEEAFCRKSWKMVLDLLGKLHSASLGPSGVVGSVVQAIRRENSWITWKNDRAPSLEVNPMTGEEQKEIEASLTRVRQARSGKYAYNIGTAALQDLWTGGVPPPQPGSTRRENEEGIYVDVPTDGLEELEFPPLGSMDLSTYLPPWTALEKRADARRSELDLTFTGRKSREQNWRRRTQLRALQAYRTKVIGLKRQLHLLEAKQERLRAELHKAQERTERSREKDASSGAAPPGQPDGADQAPTEQNDVKSEEGEHKPKSEEEEAEGKTASHEPSDQATSGAKPALSLSEEAELQSKKDEIESLQTQIAMLKTEIPSLSSVSATVPQAQARLKQTVEQSVRERNDPPIQGLAEKQSSLAWRGLRLARDVPGSLKTLALTPFDDLGLVKDALDGRVILPHGRHDGGRAITPEPQPEPQPPAKEQSAAQMEPPVATDSPATTDLPAEPEDKPTGAPKDGAEDAPSQPDAQPALLALPSNGLGDQIGARFSSHDSNLPPTSAPPRTEELHDAPADEPASSTNSPLTEPPAQEEQQKRRKFSPNRSDSEPLTQPDAEHNA